jgi:hypothetical protein
MLQVRHKNMREKERKKVVEKKNGRKTKSTVSVFFCLLFSCPISSLMMLLICLRHLLFSAVAKPVISRAIVRNRERIKVKLKSKGKAPRHRLAEQTAVELRATSKYHLQLDYVVSIFVSFLHPKLCFRFFFFCIQCALFFFSLCWFRPSAFDDRIRYFAIHLKTI